MAAIVLDNPLDQKLRAAAERIVVMPQGDVEAERARVREKLMSDGPHEPAPRQRGVESAAMTMLGRKLLGDDVPPAAEPARA